MSSLSPEQQYSEHSAAVKAIAWSPHQVCTVFSGVLYNLMVPKSLQESYILDSSVQFWSVTRHQYPIFGTNIRFWTLVSDIEH